MERSCYEIFIYSVRVRRARRGGGSRRRSRRLITCFWDNNVRIYFARFTTGHKET